MTMPMGFMIGKMFMWSLVNKHEDERDQENAAEKYSFLPYLTAMLAPMGTILAIQMIIQGDE